MDLFAFIIGAKTSDWLKKPKVKTVNKTTTKNNVVYSFAPWMKSTIVFLMSVIKKSFLTATRAIKKFIK